MIRNIFFDLGGVIVTLNRENCLNAFSNILGFPDFGKYLSAYAQKGFFAEFENGDYTAAQFRQIIRKHSTINELTDSEIDYAVGCFLTGVDVDKVRYMVKLKKRYNLFLLSNINPIAWKRSKALFSAACGVKMKEIFSKRFLSYRMKLSKPGEEIFKEAIKESGIVPCETLYIDDSPLNIETGKRLGFKTLLFDTEGNMEEQVSQILDKLSQDD